MTFPWPPLRLVVASTIAGLVASYWLDVRGAVLVGFLVLYLLLVVIKA